MPEIGAYENVVLKFKDEGLKSYVDAKLPYGNMKRGAWFGTFQANVGIGQWANIHSIQMTAGKQLKLLFLRVWTQDSNGAIFRITQTGGDVGGAPDGVVNYPMLEGAGAEVLGPCSLQNPIHVLEGSVVISIYQPQASPDYYGITYWGVEG